MEIKYTTTISRNLAFLLSIVLLATSACKKDNAAANYDRPVVEGYLIPGQPIKVKVYYQKYMEDTLSYGYPISNLKLQVSNGNTIVNLTEVDKGIYEYADDTFLKENNKYTLSFTCAEKQISATTKIPSKPINFKASATDQNVPVFSFGSTPTAFIPIQFSWSNLNLTDYYMLSFQCTENNPIRLSTRRPGNNYSLNSETLVGQTNTYNTTEENFGYSGKHNVLLFHINKEYYDALTMSNRASSLNLTNPATNVINGLGIFTGLRADTLQINVSQ